MVKTNQKISKEINNPSSIIPSNFRDVDGPLPYNAYRTTSDYCNTLEYEAKRNCLLTVAVDVNPFVFGEEGTGASASASSMNPQVDAVRAMQSFIDAGFTSFQIAPPPPPPFDFSSSSSPNKRRNKQEQNKTKQQHQQRILKNYSEKYIYRSLLKETPRSVLDKCRLSISLLNVVPDDDDVDEKGKDRYNYVPFGNGLVVRESISDSLLRMGCDSIDCVQVPYQKGSLYHLDVLDVLFDMQREGMIRSIEGLNMPPELLTSAESCGFHLENNQIQYNILDPTSYYGNMKQFYDKDDGKKMKLLTSSPLAGGLLADRYVKYRLGADGRPPPDLSTSQRRHLQTTVRSWAEYHEGGGNTPWMKFHNLVLGTLGDISFKHRTSAAAVALRWSMQTNKHLGSVVVRSGLGLGKEGVDYDGRPYERTQDLREAFGFELDEEDMERLYNVAGKIDLSTDPMDDFYNGENGGFSLEDLSNKKLWL